MLASRDERVVLYLSPRCKESRWSSVSAVTTAVCRSSKLVLTAQLHSYVARELYLAATGPSVL
jgi:hypothetical protein